MNILVDTNIIIGFLKGKNDFLNVFKKEKIIISGITYAELLHGCKHQEDYQIIEKIYEQYSSPKIDIINWYHVGRNLSQLRFSGLTIPFQDVIIATQSLDNDLLILTNDKHFEYMKNVLKIKLFDEKL
jgi:predicted nucleic acid-binding protein